MTSKYQNSIEELEKGCGEIEIGRSPCSEGNLCNDCIIKSEGLKLGRKLTLEEVKDTADECTNGQWINRIKFMQKLKEELGE